MAKLVVVAVRDSAVDAFLRPLFVPSTAVGVRAFKDACRSDEQFKAHPEDYALFELGTFDEQTGRMENLGSPAQLVRGVDMKEM